MPDFSIRAILEVIGAQKAADDVEKSADAYEGLGDAVEESGERAEGSRKKFEAFSGFLKVGVFAVITLVSTALFALGNSVRSAAADSAEFQTRFSRITDALAGYASAIGTAIVENANFLAALDRVGAALESGPVQRGVAALASGLTTLVTKLFEFVSAAVDFAAGVGTIIGSISEFINANEILRVSFELVVGVLERISSLATLTVKPIVNLLTKISELGAESKKAAEGSKATADGIEGVGSAAAGAVPSLSQILSQIEKIGNSAPDAATATEGLADKLRSLGIVLEEDVAKKLEENEELLRRTEEEYRRGERTAGDYARVQSFVAAETRRLTGALEDGNKELGESPDAYADAEEGADDYDSAVRRLTGSLRGLREEQGRVNETSNLAGGTGAFGGTLSGGSQLFPDSAVANTAIRDGRRVRVTAGGGRQLD